MGFLSHQRRPSKGVAGVLLCAILSDTLNLQGPTTTEYDKMMVSVLAEIAGVDELLVELVACKKEKGLAALFLAVVNIVDLRGTLLLCGPAERSLARVAFPDGSAADDAVMDLGKRVSRKKDYIPAITRAIKAGWGRPAERGPSTVDLASLGKLEVDPTDPHERAVRKGGTQTTPKTDDDAAGRPMRVVG